MLIFNKFKVQILRKILHLIGFLQSHTLIKYYLSNPKIYQKLKTNIPSIVKKIVGEVETL